MKGKRLIFFTNAYPYGKALEWKKRELEAISREFEEVIVIPFSFEGNEEAKAVPAGVKVWEPVFTDTNQFYQPKKLPALLLSPDCAYFLKEFLSKKVYSNSYWFKNWVVASNRIFQLKQQAFYKRLTAIEEKESTVMYFFWGNTFAHLLPFFKKLGFSKFLVRFHGFDLYAERSGGYQAYQQSVLKHSSLLAPISRHGLSYLQNRHAIPFAAEVLRLGVRDFGLSQPSTDGVLRIFSCSRLIKLKRVPLLVAALKHLQDFPVEWVHIGDGEEQEVVLEQLKQVPENVTVKLLGWMDASLVPQYYENRAADLFINVSESEGVPVSIMEAFAAGIPAMATDVGGVREIVNGENGILLPKEITEAALAGKIKDYYKLDEQQKIKMRKQARATFENKCNSALLEQELVQKLKSL